MGIINRMKNIRPIKGALLAAVLLAACGSSASAEGGAVVSTGFSLGSGSDSKTKGESAPAVQRIEVTEFTGEEEREDIEIEHVSGSTYEGWIMFVHDPNDISVQVNPYLGTYADAPPLYDYVKTFKAVGGINAGGFEDVGGNGNGSIPQGIVIHDGKLVYGDLYTYSDIIGIDSNNRLVCVGGTGQQALDWGMKEAVTFGPVFISNYQDVFDRNYSNLVVLNPRSAIGQQTDGTFMLVVLDGRGPSSFGAKYEDVVELFKKYDTVNAANLDGGNSSAMIYNGEYVNNTVSMYGSRNLPTVFLVKEGEQK